MSFAQEVAHPIIDVIVYGLVCFLPAVEADIHGPGIGMQCFRNLDGPA